MAFKKYSTVTFDLVEDKKEEDLPVWIKEEYLKFEKEDKEVEPSFLEIN